MIKIKTFQPLLNRCLIQKIIPQQVSKGGIILSDKADKDARFGKVIAVGAGERDDNGNVTPTSVKVGEYVLLPEYQGTKVSMEDTEHEYVIYKDTELLGTVEGIKH